MNNVRKSLSHLNSKIIVVHNPRAPESESFRSLRTNILRVNPDAQPRLLLFASAHPEEGKTITAINLAITMAEIGKRTLLIDFDLRRPAIHIALGLKKEKGLSEILYGTEEWDKTLKFVGIENLSVITSGSIPSNPAEIVGSDTTKCFLEEVKKIFDFIILDAPCILAVTDGLILSSIVDGILLLVMADKTPREAVQRSINMLRDVKGNLLGIIFNRVNLHRSHYYYYYYYGARKDNK